MPDKKAKTDEVSAFMKEMHEKFTAADLAKYAEVTPTVSLQSVIDELELGLAKHQSSKQTKKDQRRSA